MAGASRLTLNCILTCALSLPRPSPLPLPQAQSYTNYFADALVAEAKKDARIVGIHAAMGGGTGMNRVEKVRGSHVASAAHSSLHRAPKPQGRKGAPVVA